MIAAYAVALFWVLAYAWLGWPGVLLVAAIGALCEGILFHVDRLQAEADHATGLRRLGGYQVDSTRNGGPA